MHLGMLIMVVYNERRTAMKYNNVSQLRNRSNAINATLNSLAQAKEQRKREAEKAAEIAAIKEGRRVMANASRATRTEALINAGVKPVYVASRNEIREAKKATEAAKAKKAAAIKDGAMYRAFEKAGMEVNIII